MRAVLEHPLPRLAQERLRLVVAVQRLQRLRVPLEPALGTRARRLEVDARRHDARQQVRARRGAHLAAPGRETVFADVREVLRERADARV